MNKKQFFYSLPIILLLVVVVAGWFATDYLGNKARQEIIQDSQRDASTLSIHISDTLNNIEGAVKSLSGSPWVAPTLLSKRVQDIERANRTLDRYNAALNASVSYLMDANGTAVASSNRNDPDSFLGISYRFRPYFQEAAKGKPYHYFALGITSRKRAFYASYPVQNRLGGVIGVVTMRKDLDDMETFLIQTAFCFLTSPDGIIFLSSKPGMVLKSLSPLDKTKQRKLIASRQFGNKLSEAVTPKKIADGTEVTLEGKDYFVSKKEIGHYGWSTVVLTPTDRILIYKLTGILVTIFICFLIIVFSGIIYLTDRSRNAIRQSEVFLSNIFDNSPHAQWISDERGTLIKQNQACRDLFHITDEDVVGKYNIFKDKIVEKQGFMPCVRAVFERGESANFTITYNTAELRHLNNQQKVSLFLELNISPVKNGDGKVKNAVIQHVDITERKRAEERLKESEKKYRLLADNIHDVVFLMDMNLNYIYISPSVKLLTGYEQEKALKRTPAEILTSSSEDLAIRTLTEIMEMEKSEKRELNVSRTLQLEVRRKDGTTVWTEVIASIVRDKNQLPVGIMGVTRDITERKEAEEALKDSELKYRDIFENAIEGIYQTTIEGRFITANAALARMAGYDSPEELIESIKDIETQLYVHPKDRKRFLEIMEAKGFVEGFEVEFYKKDGSTFWVVINARTVKDEQGKILYVEGLIEDITIRRHAEEELHQTLDSLKKSVGTTIQVLMSAVESRDPYTSGHQLRVADLARTIATEMGLAQEKIEGIRMAGSIHDIGKLSIPAEILVKPTKLTDTEFSIIKEHSQIGHDMLKDVESPWPLAEIVLQHHERMNGSGYPRNLKGDEIIIEARIMAVADVVEAMASNRPYRPNLGIEAALEEITINKGILYDNTVTDACLKLFREKKYKFT